MSNNANQNNNESSGAMKFIVPILLVILAIAAIGFITTMKAGIDKEYVTGKVDEWIAHSESRNPELDISYQAIEMAGGATDRHAIIRGVALVDTREVDGATETMKLDIPNMELHPESVTLDAFRAVVKEPITYTDENEHKTEITFEPALTTNIVMKEKDNQEMVHFDQPLAGNIKFDAKSDQKSVVMELAEGSKNSGHYALADPSRGQFVVDWNDITMHETNSDKGKLEIKAVDVTTNWRHMEDDQGAFDIQFTLADLFTNEETMPYGPVSMAMKLDYTGPLPEDGKKLDWAQEKALVDLKEFTIKADDVALMANVGFQTGRGEILPVGEGEITVENFAFVLAELRKHEMLGETEEQLLRVIAKQITGEELEAIADLNITLKRADGGSLQIGESSFEELFAIFLTGGKMQPGMHGQPGGAGSSKMAPDEMQNSAGNSKSAQSDKPKDEGAGRQEEQESLNE